MKEEGIKKLLSFFIYIWIYKIYILSLCVIMKINNSISKYPIEKQMGIFLFVRELILSNPTYNNEDKSSLLNILRGSTSMPNTIKNIFKE